MEEMENGRGFEKPVSSYRLPDWLKKAINEEAKKNGMSETELVTALMGEYARRLGYKSPQDLLLEKMQAPLKKTKEMEASARVAGE